MLVELLANFEGMKAIGLDLSEEMCKAFRYNAQKYDMEGRMECYEGDVRQMKQVIPAKVLEEVDIVHGGSILNEFFRNDEEGEAINFLKMVRECFEGKDILMVLFDYYGILGKPNSEKFFGSHRHTVLHDMLQSISGQGVPPENLFHYKRIYEKAGWKLFDYAESFHFQMHSFVHFLSPISSEN